MLWNLVCNVMHKRRLEFVTSIGIWNLVCSMDRYFVHYAEPIPSIRKKKKVTYHGVHGDVHNYYHISSGGPKMVAICLHNFVTE